MGEEGGNETETSRSMKRKRMKRVWKKSTKKKEKERGSGRNKKNSLFPVFHQGRNYTFTRVFSEDDGPHRSNHLDVLANFQHKI